ncbi:N-acetylglucosamine kinase [Stakelama sp. CBK3Z-3]|uniref:N-acetylglucosamine kinase n=1 Tax=Stakelama flava TaxID=2860338 RepID=A0ABS6XKD7_9SPHN|nr:BadF/BadG/BcrA/BcrD ATPase family protein [Stakelama flava]MBW4330674.1 N-acetylglucosamine kinase [Stakelama flava]
MNPRNLYLGIDGGGTKTEFVCIDQAGECLVRHREPTTYHLQVGLDGADRVIRNGIGAICAALDIAPTDIAQAFFGLPAFGEDSEADPQLVKLCGAAMGHDRYTCGNDMICGWAGSLACADGINLVAGTGSIGYGERQGRSARVGGWGEIFSDEGSAYWIALQGLNAFTRMSDGRLNKGPLYRIFREALSLDDDLDICSRIMGEHGLQRDGIAALASIVATAADTGDATARDIQIRAADELVRMAISLSRTLGFSEEETVPLSWSGGVLRNVRAVQDAFRGGLSRHRGFDIVEPRHDPGYGAALYARHIAGG